MVPEETGKLEGPTAQSEIGDWPEIKEDGKGRYYGRTEPPLQGNTTVETFVTSTDAADDRGDNAKREGKRGRSR
jgi:hypothetical protein